MTHDKPSLAAAQLTDAERAALVDLARTLRERCGAREVILFGSRARGDAGPDSDIDVLCLNELGATWEACNQIWTTAAEVRDRHDVFFQVIVVGWDDWDHGVSQALPLKRNVERDGIRL
jgi:predicted nucleotidyltransferase